MQGSVVQCSTVQYIFSAVQCIKVQCSAVQFSAVHRSSVKCSAVKWERSSGNYSISLLHWWMCRKDHFSSSGMKNKSLIEYVDIQDNSVEYIM